MNEKKKYTFEIFGEQYTLVSDESEHQITKAAEMINALMQEIAQKSGITDVKKIAVLVALRTASELLHRQQDLEEIKMNQDDLLEYLDHEIAEVMS